MSVAEIKQAISALPSSERDELLSWLDDQMFDAWDMRIESDLATGKFDAIKAQVRERVTQGQLHAVPGAK